MNRRSEAPKKALNTIDQEDNSKNRSNFFKSFLKRLGPGVITGASDDDPSAIATFSQAGAQFGNSLLWTMIFSYPLKGVIQEISARIGRVTGRGIAGNMCFYYPVWIGYLIIGLMVIANLINIGADFAAMGSAFSLLVGGTPVVYSVIFAIISLLLQIYIPYTKYVKILKWLALALFSYVITGIIMDIKWTDVLKFSVIPKISDQEKFLTVLVAIFGATISPYLFFWQASQEIEEVNNTPDEFPLNKAPEQAGKQIKRIQLDTYIGMAFSNIVAFFIILTTSVTIFANNPMEINSASQAAEALKPLAGKFAFLLFSAGIIGTGKLAIPILAGSAAYAVGEVLRWQIGLEEKPGKAKGFYSIIAFSTLIGLSLNFTTINPIQALFWSAVINGFIAVPVMVVLMLLSSSRKVMGRFRIPFLLRFIGWISTLAMLIVVMILLFLRIN
jgi:NRAMP (natural resistance-associated macrophage protein)-like metal ion transporter